MPQIQWAINSYRARALPLSAQRLINFYAEAAPKDAKDPVVLYGTPGIKEWANPVGDGPIRGMEKMDGVLYAMSGCTLYSVDSTGRATALGSIGVGASSTSSSITGATNEASATFQVTAGSESIGTNRISSITVEGTDISGAVDFATDNATTAQAIVDAINRRAAGDIPDMIYSGINLDVSAAIDAATAEGAQAPVGFAINPAGTRMIVSTDADQLHEFDLTDGDLDTAIHTGNFLDIGNGSSLDIDSDPSEIKFDDDGSKLFITGSNQAGIGPGQGSFTGGDANIYTLTLATDYSIVGATYTDILNVQSINQDPVGLAIKDDGLKAFMYGLSSSPTGPLMYELDLGTTYVFSTATVGDTANVPFRATPDFNSGNGIFVSPNGQLLYTLIGSGTNKGEVHAYDVPTPWEILSIGTTEAFVADLNVLTSTTVTPVGIFLNSDQTKMYVSDTGQDTIFQFALPSDTVLYLARVGGVNDDEVIIEAVDGTGTDANGLPVIITTAGDVQVDDNNLILAGAFTMPAIVTFTGGGGIPSNCSGKVSMSHNAASTPQLVIVDGTNGWIYTTTGGLVQITDGDFFSADVVDFQDQYFAFNRAGTDQFFLSNLNDGTVYTATDIATAEGDPDEIVSLISQRRELWLFGDETTEIWYNSGNADFPFSRFEGGFLERGCAAAFSIAEDDNSLFWLGEDRIFYRADGYQPQRISQHGIEEALRKYEIVDDACAFIYTMAGHKFYVCTFPSEKATWVYDITTGLWHERHSFGLTRWSVNVYAEAYGKHLVGDFEKGRIGELDLDTYQEYGVTMQGQATGPVVYADRKRIFHRRFELDIEAGTGLTSGQGSDPQVWLDWSDDGGHTFSERKPWRSMGKIGAYGQRLRWLRMGKARQRIYRLTVADPVKRSIIAAHLDAAAGDH